MSILSARITQIIMLFKHAKDASVQQEDPIWALKQAI